VGHSIKWPGLAVQPPLQTCWRLERMVGCGSSAVVEDKLNDGLSKPVRSEVFVPDTLIEGNGNAVAGPVPDPRRFEFAPCGTALRSTRWTAISRPVTDVPRPWTAGFRNSPSGARGHLISWLFGRICRLGLWHWAAVGAVQRGSRIRSSQRTNEFRPFAFALGAPRSHVAGSCFQLNNRKRGRRDSRPVCFTHSGA